METTDMPTVVKRVRARDLPPDWQEDFAPDATVEVRLSSVPKQTQADRASLREIIDSIRPTSPAPGYPGSVDPVGRLLKEHQQRIANPDA